MRLQLVLLVQLQCLIQHNSNPIFQSFSRSSTSVTPFTQDHCYSINQYQQQYHTRSCNTTQLMRGNSRKRAVLFVHIQPITVVIVVMVFILICYSHCCCLWLSLTGFFLSKYVTPIFCRSQTFCCIMRGSSKTSRPVWKTGMPRKLLGTGFLNV